MRRRFHPATGILLILLLGVPRFILVLQANATRSYQFIPIVFIIMILLPFLFLNKDERKTIGLKRPTIKILLPAFMIGVMACLGSYVLGLFYDHSISNWFVYIANSYPAIPGLDRFTLFLMVAIPSMIFSPLGEEFFYRGWVHQCFVDRWGETRASYIDALAFAFTHLAHFGIVYTVQGWQFLPLPALLWTAQMFLVSLLFTFCRNQSGSLWGAVVCHAGFNVAMSYIIVYKIL